MLCTFRCAVHMMHGHLFFALRDVYCLVRVFVFVAIIPIFALSFDVQAWKHIMHRHVTVQLCGQHD